MLRHASVTLLAVLALSAAACGDDSSSGSGGSTATGTGGAAASTTDASSSASSTTTTSTGVVGSGGAGGSTASTGTGSGGAEACDFPEISLDVTVTLPDGTEISDEYGETQGEHRVFGYVYRDSDTTLSVEHATNGEVTTIELFGATVPEELPHGLEYGVDVELGVAWIGYAPELEIASLYVELLDADEGRVLFALFAGEPRGVDGARVTLDLLEPECIEATGVDAEVQDVPVRIAFDGASVDLSGGETLAAGDTGLAVEHQGTIVSFTLEPTAATGILVRPVAP